MSGDTQAALATPLVHELVRRALSDDPAHGMQGLVEAIAVAVGATSAVLWEAVGDDDRDRPSVLATWCADVGDTGRHEYAADPLTVLALTDQTVALPDGDPVGTARPVMAALAVSYLDGSPGALTLYGAETFTAECFDMVADALGVLPTLGNAVRDRQSLELSRRCDRILTEAEQEAGRGCLTRDELRGHLSRACSVIGDALGCEVISLYLSDTGMPTGPFRLEASSSGQLGNGHGPDALSRRAIHSKVACVAPPPAHRHDRSTPCAEAAPGSSLIAVPMASGDRVWGAISCAAPYQRPFYFTRSDISLLELVASQLAQYWMGWLQRRVISTEIESWRRLAADVTQFNQLIALELKRKEPRDTEAERSAVRMVRHVLPDCLEVVLDGAPGVTRAEAALLSDSGSADRWQVRTRVSVGEEVFGWLEASGCGPEAPPNVAQVCEIVGDQLGLYYHLRRALTTLRDTQREVEATVHGQAKAFEDLEHQLAGPLLAATSRTERLLGSGRMDGRADLNLRAVRGLCRRASRVAMSAGVFASLSQGRPPKAKTEVLGADDVLRMLIITADDAQILRDPREQKRFAVDRESVKSLGRALVRVDSMFLEQCVGNVVDNAGKYSYEETQIDIAGEVGRDRFAIVVSSRGLELPLDDVGSCTQRNWRGRGARGLTGEGSGLGLWIADHLMTSMGGRVEIRPAGPVTSVRLELPLIQRSEKRT